MLHRPAKASLLASFVVALLAQGCDRAAPAPTPAPAADQPPRIAILRPLSQLLPDRLTHIAVDLSRNVYFVQESDDGNDVVFVAGSDNVAMPTVLTSAAVLAASGADAATAAQSAPLDSSDTDVPADSGATHKSQPPAGNFQSLLPLPDGRLMFYFCGTAGHAPRSCVGIFNSQSGTVSILAGAARLASVSKMGPALEVARGQLIPSRPGPAAAQGSDAPLLLLRHSDAWVLLRVTQAASGTDLAVALDQLTLASPATQHTTAPDDQPAQPLQLTRESVQLLPAADGLLALDLHAGAIWHIDPQGRANRIALLIGFPRVMSLPAVARDGSIRVIGADGPLFAPSDSDADLAAAPTAPHTHYPAVLQFSPDGKLAQSINADAIRGYPNLPVFGLQIAALAADNDTAWVAFDTASGQLIRMYLQ